MKLVWKTIAQIIYISRLLDSKKEEEESKIDSFLIIQLWNVAVWRGVCKQIIKWRREIWAQIDRQIISVSRSLGRSSLCWFAGDKRSTKFRSSYETWWWVYPQMFFRVGNQKNAEFGFWRSRQGAYAIVYPQSISFRTTFCSFFRRLGRGDSWQELMQLTGIPIF